jgi:hypothetical protein
MSAPASLVSRLRSRVPAGAIVAAVYLLLAIVVTISAWRAPSVTYIGEGPDPIQSMWAIGWAPFAVSHGMNPLLTTSMNAPSGFDLLWPDAFSIPLMLFWPVTALFGAMVTYDLVITLSLAVASFFAYLVIRRWIPGIVAAACGGLLYGFSPYMTGQSLGHLSLVLAGVTPPLALMLLDEIVVRQRHRPRTLGVLAALLAVVQFFIAQEILLTEILVAAIVTVVLAFTHRELIRSHVGFVLRTLGFAAVPALFVLAYPVWLQFLGPGHVLTSGAIHGTDIYETNALNFVVPSVAQLISPPVATGISSHFSGNASEWDAYLGIPLVLVLIAATVRFWSVPVIRTAGIVALIIAVLSLGPHLNINGHPILAVPLPWWIPEHMPVLDDILPNRLMVYVDLAAAITFAFTLRILWLLRSSLALNVVVAIAVLVPLAPTLPVPTTTLDTSAPFTSATTAAAFNGADVLFEPYPSLDYPDAMIWQRAAGYTFTMAGGYIIGPTAPGSDDLQRSIFDLTSPSTTVTLTGADRLALAGEFRTLGIDAVVVGSGATPGMASLFTQFLGKAPIHDDGFLVWQFLPFH